MKKFSYSYYSLVFGVVLGLSIIPKDLAWSQEYNFNDLPVLNPKPDFNGVDPASGSYLTSSPLKFNAPGSGNLNIQQMFNGRTDTFSLNIYLHDDTYQPTNTNPETKRDIRIHHGGTDKLFTCGFSGECTQKSQRDGSRLTRVATHEYVFIDKFGAVFSFFPLNTQLIYEDCYSPDYQDCNYAEYRAYTYVSSIAYASGEKLTYSPFSQVKTVSGQKYVVDSIQSNLGYRMEFESTVPSNFTPQAVAGHNWFRYRHFGRNPGTWSETRFSLYRGTQLVNTLTTERILTATQPERRIVKHTDDIGRLYEIEYQGGSVTRCRRTVDGRHFTDRSVLVPVKETTPSGIVTSISYFMLNAANWHFKEATGGVNASIPVHRIQRGGLFWEYDDKANEKTLIDPESNLRTVEFSWLGSVFEEPADSINPQCRNTSGSIIKAQTDELYRRFEYQYGSSFEYGLLKSAELPEGNGYGYEYDTRGNLTTITQRARSGSSLPERVVFKASYPGSCSSSNSKFCNKPTWVEDAKGLRTNYTYSATHGGVLTVTQPAQPNGVRPQIRFTYNGVNTGDGTVWRQTRSSLCLFGSSCAGGEYELVTETTYWGNTFLPQTITRKAGDDSVIATTSFIYNNAGLVTRTTDATGQSTHYLYDAVGRKVGEIGPDPDGSGPLPRIAFRVAYNADDKPTHVYTGTVTGSTLPALNAMVVNKVVESLHDNLGRKIRDTVKSGSTIYAITQYSYDVWNRPICTAQRMNLSSFPSEACQIGAAGVDGYDRITKNIYDQAGQLKEVSRAYATPVEQRYATYEYDENGKRTVVIDANDNKATFIYDGYDRLTRWYFPSKERGSLQTSNTDYENYGYDLNDNRISHRKRNGATLTYLYDNLNRVIRKTVPSRTGLSTQHTRNVYYSYDNVGNMWGAKFDSLSGPGVSQEYNVLGHMLESVVNQDDTMRWLAYHYNANGTRTALVHSDSQVFRYNRDAMDRLTSITHTNAGTLASYDYESSGRLYTLNGGISTTYGYDGIGRLQSLGYDLSGTVNDNTYTYAYNPASQIKRLTTSNDKFTPVNGQQNTHYVVNGLNQYTSVSGVQHTYDNIGNLTFDGQTHYLYDQENRLVRATTTTGAVKAELWYDPLGRLYKVQGPTATTKFLYDGDDLVAEYSGTSTAVKDRYVHGTSVDDPVAWFSGSTVTTNNRRHLRANHQGSIVAVGNSSGAMVSLPRYDNWGKPQSTQPVRFGYTGQVWIQELGLWHYKARMYSPTLGRFMQTDPVGYEDQMNLYAYVHNDPLNYTDPTGEFAHVAIGAFAGGLISGIAYAVTTDKFSTKDLVVNMASGAVVGAATAAVPGAIAAGSLNFGSKAANVAASIGNASAAGAAGSVGTQLATKGEVDFRNALVAGAANATGLAVGNAVTKPATAIATVRTAGNPGLPVTSLNGNTFMVGKVEATSVTSEGMRQLVQDVAGEITSAVTNFSSCSTYEDNRSKICM